MWRDCFEYHCHSQTYTCSNTLNMTAVFGCNLHVFSSMPSAIYRLLIILNIYMSIRRTVMLINSCFRTSDKNKSWHLPSKDGYFTSMQGCRQHCDQMHLEVKAEGLWVWGQVGIWTMSQTMSLKKWLCLQLVAFAVVVPCEFRGQP